MAVFQTSKGKVLLCRLKSFVAFEVNIGFHFQRFRCHPAVHEGRAPFSSDAGACTGSGEVEISKWRKLNSRYFGITGSMISVSSWTVLNRLRAAGFEAYLVGGCVRDLILHRMPKDFDVITTASLKQVKQKFRRAIIVGRKFPICRVSVEGSVVEVSSFGTATEQHGSKLVGIFQMPKVCDPRDYIRCKDAMRRDFTVNSLFFDPFLKVIFDYTNGVEDLMSLKLRTVIPAHLSFKEDKARILRGLRLAARLNLSFVKETETALYDLSFSIAELSQSRISMEMNYMLAYGAAEPSLIWLKRLKLLEILLPLHAAYLSKQMDHGLGLCSLMLMKLVSNLDQLIACNRPCNDSLWVAVLVFHLALFGNPQPAVVILTFASLLHHGTWEESIKLSRENAVAAQAYMPEISDNSNNLSDDEIAESVIQFTKQVGKSVQVLVKMDSLSEAMARFPEFPHSGLVFVSRRMGRQVWDVFSILTKGVRHLKAENRCPNIDYKLLIEGDVCEVRFVLGKIILNSMISGASDTGTTKVDRDNIQVLNPLHKSEILESTNLNKGVSTGKDKARRIKLPFKHERSQDYARTVNADRVTREQGSAPSAVRRHGLALDNTQKNAELMPGNKSPFPSLSGIFM